MSKVIAVINQKGGVGKTTTTANLAYAFSQMGRDVLVIDYDSQASLTNYLNVGLSEEDSNYYGVYEMLIKEYSKGDTRKKCWIMQTNSLNVENFGNSQFATVVKVPYLGKLVSAPLYYTKNRINAGKRSSKIAPYVNNKTSFCDTEISYKECDLSKYRESAIRYRKKIRDLNMALRPYKRRRIKLFKKLVITYLRYNFGLRILDRMDEIEALYQAKDYDALDEIIGSYVKYLRKYKNVYLSERLNEIIYDVYNFKPDQLYDDVPEVYKEGIKIYDNDGKYVRTLGE